MIYHYNIINEKRENSNQNNIPKNEKNNTLDTFNQNHDNMFLERESERVMTEIFNWFAKE
jgi:hypothetical protein